MRNAVALAAALLLLGSAACAAKSASNGDSDAGEDSGPVDEGDANTHPYVPPPEGGATGACAIQVSHDACRGPGITWCEESWTTASMQLVELCAGGTLYRGSACPTAGIAGYCVNTPSQAYLWGDVTYYYKGDPDLSTGPDTCQADQGTWCQPQ